MTGKPTRSRLEDYDYSTRYEAEVISSARLTPAEGRDEVRDMELWIPTAEFDGEPGQSLGVLAPGELGQEHHFRLYSLAGVPQRIDGASTRVRICVRRCHYIDEYSGEEYRGIASNFLCDLRTGDKVMVAGPYDPPFEIPEERDANLILIGAGTGIAPFRAFVRRLYGASPPFHGRIWLFHGGRTGVDLLYRNEERDDFALYYDRDTFDVIAALSQRPHWTDQIDWHTAIGTRSEVLWKMMAEPKTYVYVAGLEPIRDQLDEVFSTVAGSKEKWERRRAELEAGRRWTELLY